MRKKIPAALINRSEKVIKEKKLQKNRPVLLLPRMLQVDEWNEIASQMQGILKENVMKDTAPDYGAIPRLELVVSR